ncbi:hypothetical protein ABPG75_003336 [Micractinium tetrahymenae]
MEALLLYASDDEDSGSEQALQEGHRPSKRSKGPGEAATCLASSTSPSRTAAPPRSLLPSAAALLDGSYSPPPAAQQRELEQALLHQGRTRTFPHTAGSFATHIYIEVPPPPSCLGPLGKLLAALAARLPALKAVVHAPASSSQGTAATPSGDAPQAAVLAQPLYHVSLSRTVPLRLHQIEPLVESLRGRLRQQDTFSIRIGRPEVLVNDEGSRTFLSLAACCPSRGGSSDGSGSGGRGDSGGSSNDAACRAADGGGGSGLAAGGRAAGEAAGCEQAPLAAQQLEEQRVKEEPPPQQYSPHLVALCHAASSVFAAHGLPRFHASPRPHASVAWLLGSEQQQLEAALAAPEVQEAAERLAAQDWQLSPTAIICKAGQRPYTVWQAADHGGGTGAGPG